ncbi:MAG: Endonuclease/exonuclease/phosphatase [Myxococcales bacterium]|nr:Endonuclease/exonuclease/phosphatase [Myxococcales bacterium]
MRFRVVSYNVHKCIGGMDRRYDPSRVAATIAHHEPDLVLLQEVDSLTERSLRHRQVDVLGDRLSLRHRTYFANVRVRGGGDYGNAILSRFPILETQNIDLTIGPKKRRGGLHAKLRVRLASGRTRTLHVFALHLGLSGIERKMQIRRFLASSPFATLDARTPVIIGGDFNDVWGTLGNKMFVPAGFRGPKKPVATFPAFAPFRALDSIYVRGELHLVGVERSRLQLARTASDHLPLVADIEFHPRPPAT